ncbi:MAG: metallophosphoesterase [Dysgonamonadaceae bacterium]|jgi:predicted phosphodiesterase|nr:metallophosphoesterase [Dysgonamonadaceae bacterium]
MRIFILLLFSLSLSIVHAADSLRIALISDLHYLASGLAAQGKAAERYEAATGRNVSELHSVLDATLDSIVNAKTEVLLIAGDMTNHGERDSHIELLGKIEPLRAAGMRIFVIPGNHDINVPNARAYRENEIAPTPGISPSEFEQLYAPFGYSEALRRDTASLSYLTALTDSLWLLCIDTNRYAEYKSSSISGGRILPETLQWALDILREVREKRITVLGMMHHGLVEHLPYQSVFFADYLIDDWENNARILADNGLQVVFTGHFHANDITSLTSENGNRIFDVETGSLSQYPLPFRLLTLKGKTLDIDTRFVESIPGNADLQEKYRLKMEAFSRHSTGAKLQNLGMPISGEAREALAEMLVQMSLLHAHGDETLDDKILKAVVQFAAVAGDDDFDVQSFQLDFPPADNQLTIQLK